MFLPHIRKRGSERIRDGADAHSRRGGGTGVASALGRGQCGAVGGGQWSSIVAWEQTAEGRLRSVAVPPKVGLH